MPRIQIKDLPVLEGLSATQTKGILGGADVNRYVLGFEKTFIESDAAGGSSYERTFDSEFGIQVIQSY